MVVGPNAPLLVGDYISNVSGLNSYLVFFIEVPPGLPSGTRLYIEIFDADIGDTFDQSLNELGEPILSDPDSQVIYYLDQPDGAPYANSGLIGPDPDDCDSGDCYDGNEFNVPLNFTVLDPTPGHWRLRVIMQSGDGTTFKGNDINYFEVAAFTDPIEYSFNLDSDPGWTEDPSGTAWEWGPPDAENTVGDPTEAPEGFTNIYGYAIGGEYGEITNSYGECLVVNPPIDFSSAARYNISFQKWLGLAADDKASFEASINPSDPGSWVKVASYDSTADIEWTTLSFSQLDIPELRHQPEVAFRWVMGPSNQTDHSFGWNITDIQIRIYPEINIYAYPFVVNGWDGSGMIYDSFTFYPYVTCGCSVYSNDFDAAFSGTTNATYYFEGRLIEADLTPAYESSFVSSTSAGSWAQNALDGWNSQNSAAEYGLWSEMITLEAPGTSEPNNIISHYLGNYKTLTPPPSSSPGDPGNDALRFYLLDSDFQKPLKPFMLQSVQQVLGPAQPTISETTTIRISVAVVNPTPYAITFDSSHLIKVYIPASSVDGNITYAGHLTGVIDPLPDEPFSQPTGPTNSYIEWNPGELPPRSTAILRYWLDVTPLTTNAFLVTGQPDPTGVNDTGTTAFFEDEMGADFLFGPICGLWVQAASELPTRALVSDFGSEWAGGEPVLRWATAAEQGTAGFHVSRWDEDAGGWRRLTEAPLPALPGHPQGGVYRLADPEALPGQTYQYRIEELDVHGRVLDYGPFTVTIPEPASNPDVVAAPPVDASGSRTPHPRQRRDADTPNLKPAHLKTAVAGKTAADGARPEAARVAVRADGLHAVPFDALAEALALPRAAVEALAHRGRLEITSGGRLVTYLTDLAPGAIVFYGRRSDSPYADANVYRVAVGRGQLMARADGAPPAAVASGLTFATTQDAEEDHLPAPAVTRNPESDYWFWDYLFADHPTQGAKTFTVPTPAPAGTGAAALAVRLHGGTDTGFGTDHQVSVRLNGVNVGTARWDGLTARSLRFTIDPAILRDGANAVELAAHLNDGIPYSLVYVDGFAVDYVRQARADNDRLRLAPGGMAPHAVAVDGFTRDDIVVLDITDPDAPVLQPAAVERTGRNWRAFFRCQPRHDYFAASAGTAAAVTAASPDWPSRLRETESGADYVVIAPQSLLEPAEALAAYRAGQGHRALVVDHADIYDEFNHGCSSPHAIRDFLAWAVAHWSVAPRHVVLAGRGTYDYRDLGGFGDNLLPPLYLGTSHGLAAADNRFACVAGDDNVPDLAIGRLPAATAAELQAMVDKIIAYEALPGGAWSRRALVVADNPDPAGDFPADSETVAAELPPWLRLRRISLAEQTAVEAREALVSGIATGAGLVNYLGHGGVDRLAAEGVLRLDDVPLLANGARLPLVLAFTCAAGECTIPGYPGLGEALLTRPAGGAIAVYAPAGLSDNAAAVELNAALAAELGRGHATLGEALRAALAAWAPADPTAAYHRDLYILLGDPALRLVR